MLDVSAERSEQVDLRQLTYRNIPVLDLTVPAAHELREAVDFIRSQTGHGAVYIHCAMGFSRSAWVAAAWLLAEGHAPNPQAAVEAVRRARPSVRFGRDATHVLKQFARAAPVPH